MNASYVAVVDDEAPVRTALRRLLRLGDYEVQTFTSGEEFLCSLAGRHPDCVLLDVHMPGLTGFEVQSELTRSGVTIPVVLITASDDPQLADTAAAAGAVGLLRKPFTNDALMGLIVSALGRTSP